MPGVEPALHKDRITGHSETENPKHEPCENKTRYRCLLRGPGSICKVLSHDAEKVEHADDVDQAGILEHADESVHDPGNHQLQSLWQNDKAGFLPVAQAE